MTDQSDIEDDIAYIRSHFSAAVASLTNDALIEHHGRGRQGFNNDIIWGAILVELLRRGLIASPPDLTTPDGPLAAVAWGHALTDTDLAGLMAIGPEAHRPSFRILLEAVDGYRRKRRGAAQDLSQIAHRGAASAVTVSAPQIPVVAREELLAMGTGPEVRIQMMSTLMILIGIIRGFRSDWPTSTWLLILGGVAAIFGMGRYGRTVTSFPALPNGSSAILLGFLPWGFGVYVSLIEGLWRIVRLYPGMQMSELFAGVFFGFLGYRLVFWSWHMSELGAALQKGRLVVRD